ncbi:uncharacterized protein [Ptychodera flava]|uniref:uncharacterized protein isoform X2 n=1 Tax=Ptychodera flava TaxID=63121 RepID=UPI003969DB6A
MSFQNSGKNGTEKNTNGNNGNRLVKPTERQRPSTGKLGPTGRPPLNRKESKSLTDLRSADLDEAIAKTNERKKPIDPEDLKDSAQTVEDDGGRKKNGDEEKKRLVILSTKMRNFSQIANAVLPNVALVQYKYENVTLEGLLQQISQTLGSRNVDSIACVMYSSPGSITICGNGDSKEVITSTTLSEQQNIRDFFCNLVKNYLDKDNVNARIDFLACHAAQNPDGTHIAKELESLIGVSVGISKEILGTDIPATRVGDTSKISVGELYFKVEKLEKWKTTPQSLAGFEKIRTVGKGAYGAAVLYRKKDDDSLVILKEINMHDLTAAERQMSLNEVNVLAMLDHPNIISYYDSFEEDGTLMIEMGYADGGTLHQYLANQQRKELEEKEILNMFQQMVAAIRHIHEHNILHRDLKTANIFLTKEGIVKVGDFGISKIMTSNNKGANTVLGTPYYISPEICEGKPYNEKSDIWALGCILYEMACLQKTFEGSNLPALVNKIMKGQFTPVKGNYSPGFKALIRDMLQREPEYRPSANELMYARLPELMSQYEDPVTDVDDEFMLSADSMTSRKQRTRSVLYYFETMNMAMQPIDLPCKIKIRKVAVSANHMIVVTFERAVYTWGEGSKGQLGHGDLKSRGKPEIVEALKGKSITNTCCGDGFSVFGSDNGIVMTCGDGSNGCLGHGDWSSASRPRLIEPLLSVDVTSISCGPHHVVVVGADGEVFAWGCGKDGRLGLGNEEDYCEPMEVSISEPVFIREVKCGVDGSMFLTDMGCLLACGSNEDNKLGLNNRQGFLMAMKNIFTRTEVEGRKVPTVIKALSKFKVLDMILGPYHSAVIVEPGLVYTFGKNGDGQLGTGNVKPREAPVPVKDLSSKTVLMLACGERFTVAGTEDNSVFMWGRGFKPPAPSSEESSKNNTADSKESCKWSKGHQRNPSNASIGSASSLVGVNDKTPIPERSPNGSVGSASSCRSAPPTNSNSHKTEGSLSSTKSAPPTSSTGSDSVFLSAGEQQQQQLQQQQQQQRLKSPTSSEIKGQRQMPNSTSTTSVDSVNGERLPEVILSPQPILMLDSTGSQSTEEGETFPVTLNNIICHGENLFLQVETTAPPPRRRSKKKKRSLPKRQSNNNTLQVPEGSNALNSASSHEAGDEYTSSEASELDSMGTIPTWLKKELKDSETTLPDDSEDDDDASSDDEHSSHGKFGSIKISTGLKQEIKVGRLEFSKAANRQSTGKENATAASKQSEKSERAPPVKMRQRARAASSESGVDVVEYSTDSSSSDLRATAQASETSRSPRSAKKASYGPPASIPSAKISNPSPYHKPKTPTGVQGQRPLNRLRAGRGRARTSSWTIDGVLKEPSRSHAQPMYQQDEQLKAELHKVMLEKRRAEEMLEQLQEHKLYHQQQVHVEAERLAEEREKKLRGEIDILKNELRSQNSKLQDNYHIVMQLQEQLVKLQSEQMRQNAREKRANSAVPNRKVNLQGPQSKVCIVM